MLEPWRLPRTLVAAQGVRNLVASPTKVFVVAKIREIPAAAAADGNVAGPLRVPAVPEGQQRPVVAGGDLGR